MKIAITGHSAGIGAAFADILAKQGHEIVGISRRHGHNIRVIPRTTGLIQDCDMWINNAQAGYAQTELLYQVWKQWQGSDKIIWVISTILTLGPDQPVPGYDDHDMSQYRNQKVALEQAFYQLKSKPGSPKMCLIRPGKVATQAGTEPGVDGADPLVWAQTVVDCWNMVQERGLSLPDISVGFSRSPRTL